MEELLDRCRAGRERAAAARAYVPGALREELARERTVARSVVSGPDDARGLRRLAAITAERRAADAHDLHARDRAQVEIQRALGRLRRCGSVAALVQRAPAELCRACGFTRAMISRVEGSAWIPVLPPPGVDADADSFRGEFGDKVSLPMRHMLLEAEMVRRRIAVLVGDAAADPRCHRLFIAAAGAQSYVGAPIISGRRVVGFLHADRRAQGIDVTEQDRDDARLYAEHFGLLHERAVIADEILRRSRQLLEDQRALAARLSELATSDLFLAPGTVSTFSTGEDSETVDAPPPPPAVLTTREREVVELIAAGATNRMIARELVLSENTVKTHIVKAGRKLQASSRAEIVARYLSPGSKAPR